MPALVASVDRELALVDVGTGAGLALHLDRYRYRFRDDRGGVLSVGDLTSEVSIETDVRGAFPPLPSGLPEIVDRVGIDIEPLDVSDPEVRRWVAACIAHSERAPRAHRSRRRL